MTMRPLNWQSLLITSRKRRSKSRACVEAGEPVVATASGQHD